MAIQIKHFGWKRGFNDIRDFTPESQQIKSILKKSKSEKNSSTTTPATLPLSIDNRKWCSPISDQGNLGSCTANAVVSLYEYMEKKAYGSKGNFIDGSRLFVYKLTRFLMGEEGKGDSGAYIRTALGSVRLFGVPPEKYWPYTDKDPEFDLEPLSPLYTLAQQYQSVKQFRLDYSSEPEQNIQRIKEYLTKNYAAMIGFMVFSSYSQSNSNGGCFPYPSKGESIDGGHAVLIVGYDDHKIITNNKDGKTTTGAFMIQNSWGTGWGDKGYGWIPYDYFRLGANGDVLAEDVWTITSVEYINTGEFFW